MTTSICITNELNNTKAILEEQGDQLRKCLENELNKEECKKVILDFKGIDLISTPFLNHFLGNLLYENKENYKEILSKLSFKDLDKDDIELIYLVIVNAVKED